MRRYWSSRLFPLVSFTLVCYCAWLVLDGIFFISAKSADERAYRQARRRLVPILQNKQLCSANKIDLVIVIISSVSHFLERQSIRETWGSLSQLFEVQSRRLFVMGYHTDHHYHQDVSKEAEHEQDLLYLAVDEDSSTLKELHAYRWLEKFCPNVTYTFKTEDDLFVNTYVLHELVNELQTRSEQYQFRSLYNQSLDKLFLAHLNPDANTFLFGWAFEAGKPERNARMKPFFVSYEEYPRDLYPRYCSGFGYLMDSKTRYSLAEEGFRDKTPFRFSDIYITGVLPERLQFICDVLPLTYHQGAIEECLNLIRGHKSNTTQTSSPSLPPLLVCSTGRHVSQNTFSDYYRLWTALKYVYADRAHVISNP